MRITASSNQIKDLTSIILRIVEGHRRKAPYMKGFYKNRGSIIQNYIE
jgi:hypothetical protein